MLRIDRHEEGFALTWDASERDIGRLIRTELTLEGLQRGREWHTGLVVEPYRNELETLGLVLLLLTRLGLEHTLSDDLAASLLAGESERHLIETIRDGATRSRAVAARIDEFQSGRSLLPYQREAVEVHLRVRNGADFSVPGSGKTTVALAYWAIANRTDENLGLWVLGPLSCFKPWEDEFEACFGRPPTVLRVRGTIQERREQLHRAHQYDLVLCSYQTAWREERHIVETLHRRPWLLVLDEGHYVKSMNGVLAATVRVLAPHAHRRLVLTGTTMPRSPEDLWSLFTFLWPTESLLGNAQQHALRCRRPPDAVCDELRPLLSSFFHRTCKTDLGLPPIDAQYPSISPAQIPSTQRLILRLIERRTLEEVTCLNPRDLAHLRRWRKARMIRLLQAASNPLLLANSLDPADLVDTLDDDSIELDAHDPEVVPLSELDSDLAAILRRYDANRDGPAKVHYVVHR